MTCSESPDVLSGDSYNRSGDEVRNAGLYVDVAPSTGKARSRSSWKPGESAGFLGRFS